MEGTAVLDAPGNAEAPEATDELLLEGLEPESAEGDASTESEGDDQPTDSATPDENPYDGLTPEEIAAKVAADMKALEAEIRKDAKAKADESVRQQLDHHKREADMQALARQRQAEAQAAEQVMNGALTRDLFAAAQAITKQALESGEDINPQQLHQAVFQAAQRAAIGSRASGWGAVTQELWGALQAAHPDYKASAELLKEASDAGLTRDPTKTAAVILKMHEEALRPRIIAEAQAAAAARQKSAQAAANLRQATAKKEPAPTGGASGATGGAPGRLDYTTAEIEAMPPDTWKKFTRDEQRQIGERVAANDTKYGAGTVRAAVRARWGQ